MTKTPQTGPTLTFQVHFHSGRTRHRPMIKGPRRARHPGTDPDVAARKGRTRRPQREESRVDSKGAGVGGAAAAVECCQLAPLSVRSSSSTSLILRTQYAFSSSCSTS